MHVRALFKELEGILKVDETQERGRAILLNKLSPGRKEVIINKRFLNLNILCIIYIYYKNPY